MDDRRGEAPGHAPRIEIGAEEVRRAVDGDRAALERILRALERPFFGLALRMLTIPSDAEDAAQECLVRVATRLVQFDGRSRFSTWAWRVAVNRILDLRGARERIQVETWAAGLADGLDPEAPERADDRVELGELKMRCERALLRCLAPDERVAFVLGHVLEVEAAEASEILGVEQAAFRKRLSRARERVRLALAGRCGIVDPSAPCRCHRRLRRARALDRVSRDVTTTDAPLDVAELRARISRVGAAVRADVFCRGDPPSRPQHDLVRAALAPLRAG